MKSLPITLQQLACERDQRELFDGVSLRLEPGEGLQVGLRGFEDVLCQHLSAGQQRRVALARLYLEAHPVWILDEPFTAIDRSGVAALEAHLLAHAANGGTVILTTHHSLDHLQGLRTLDLGQVA